MKTFFFSFLVFFFSFFSLSFAQISNKEKPIVPYNKEIGDWDIIIPIPMGIKPNLDFEPFILVNNNWKLPAEFTENGIELIHPSELFLWSELDYFFKAVFVDEYFNIQESPPITFWAPSVEIKINYHFSDSENLLQTEAEFFVNNDLFFVSKEGSYFSIVENNTDSIIRGDRLKIPIKEIKKNRFFGEDINFSSEKNNFLSCIVTLSNEYNEEKLRALEIKSLVFTKNNQGLIVKNLTGRGAITPYWNDSEIRKGFIFDMNGNCIKQLSVLSGEPLWLDNIPVGIYVFYVEDVGQGKIVKADY